MHGNCAKLSCRSSFTTESVCSGNLSCQATKQRHFAEAWHGLVILIASARASFSTHAPSATQASFGLHHYLGLRDSLSDGKLYGFEVNIRVLFRDASVDQFLHSKKSQNTVVRQSVHRVNESKGLALALKPFFRLISSRGTATITTTSEKPL